MPSATLGVYGSNVGTRSYTRAHTTAMYDAEKKIHRQRSYNASHRLTQRKNSTNAIIQRQPSLHPEKKFNSSHRCTQRKISTAAMPTTAAGGRLVCRLARQDFSPGRFLVRLVDVSQVGTTPPTLGRWAVSSIAGTVAGTLWTLSGRGSKFVAQGIHSHRLLHSILANGPLPRSISYPQEENSGGRRHWARTRRWQDDRVVKCHTRQ